MALDPLLAARITFALGIANLVGLLLVFFSCRCLMGTNLAQKLYQHNWYKKFYSNHCRYWWFFFLTVLLHTLFAFYAFGNPF